MSQEPQEIRIGGAREHNLKNISISIPRNKLVVFTGVSGSGKSSLVFDTLFAEGQRKYVESLSSYARQFLNQLQKPDVDYIDGLSPAIAIEQRHSSGNPRSTISTITEIYDYLRLLFAHAGIPHCPDSGQEIQSHSPSDIIQYLLDYPEDTRLILLAPIVQNEVCDLRKVQDRLIKDGFIRVRFDDEIIELSDLLSKAASNEHLPHTIEVVIDRLVIKDKQRARLSDSIETALKIGESEVIALTQTKELKSLNKWDSHSFSTFLVSPVTGKKFEPPTPRHFSFNSPLGACPECQGLGYVNAFDEELIIPVKSKSLLDGAIVPWVKAGKKMQPFYLKVATQLYHHFNLDPKTTVGALTENQMSFLLYGNTDSDSPTEIGTPDHPLLFNGIIPTLEESLDEATSELSRKKLKQYMSPVLCHSCQGGRLKQALICVTISKPGFPVKPLDSKIPGYSIHDINNLSIENALLFFDGLQFNSSIETVAQDIVSELQKRLHFLNEVGLGYLELNREFGTLSGGESQRIRLATQIGAGLVGVLYILDEPSIGLHQRDNDRLLKTLEELRNIGNSVIVVEHDQDTILKSDYLVEIGPGPGANGGHVVAAGTVQEILKNSDSITAKYLRGERGIPVPKNRLRCNHLRSGIHIAGASANNLKDIDVKIPLGAFVTVTGVSGSGKSTLVNDILCKALNKYFYKSQNKIGEHKAIYGMENINKVIVVDQSPIGKSPRSNPATYTGIFSDIREIFANLPASKIRGYEPGRFSFNNKGGRCEKCQGDGALKVEMHFLPPVFVPCESCSGNRYNKETLEIKYKGLNISDVLNLSVDEAVVFFRAIPSIAQTCETMSSVGLGYLKLGQSANTLSGGEAQRLKLASELRKKSVGSTLYILDEPTTGLHFQDIETLLEVFFKLRDSGGTILVIEHNLDIIKMADWVIDIGPGGGVDGGEIVTEGAPEAIAACPESVTGQYLKKYLDNEV